MIKRHHQGFTLIEIMVVVVIIGVMIGVVMISITPSGGKEDQSALAKAKYIQAMIQDKKEQAIIGRRVFGLRYDENKQRLDLVEHHKTFYQEIGILTQYADALDWSIVDSLVVDLGKNVSRKFDEIYWREYPGGLRVIEEEEKDIELPFFLILSDGTFMPEGELTVEGENLQEGRATLLLHASGTMELEEI